MLIMNNNKIYEKTIWKKTDKNYSTYYKKKRN